MDMLREEVGRRDDERLGRSAKQADRRGELQPPESLDTSD
jgi:hypothetical protein